MLASIKVMRSIAKQYFDQTNGMLEQFRNEGTTPAYPSRPQTNGGWDIRRL
jgi:hypothetical protein